MSAPLAVVILLALWLLVYVSRPQRPEGLNETAWRVYVHLQGSWERLRLTALLLTMFAFFLMIGLFMQAASPHAPHCTEHQSATVDC
jgi:di/tricarboxylate transporter